MSDKQDHVTQTIDRLISNLPKTINELKGLHLTSLARQLQNDLDNLKYWQGKGGLTTAVPNGCTCASRPGDDYYCQIHGGEGCWVDLKAKSDMLTEKFGEWIVSQSNDVKRSAADAFGSELKALAQTLWKVADENQT